MTRAQTQNPREAAFLALCAAEKQDVYLAEFFDRWQQECQPAQKDLHLAQEIAFGTMRRRLCLDYLAKQGASLHALPSKFKEKTLLRMALYQHFFMDRIPPYAIVDESIRLAKRHCHSSFTSFLNAALRKLVKIPLSDIKLPQGDSVEEMSIFFSYPPFFVERLIEEYGFHDSRNVLEAMNQPSVLMARDRSTNDLKVVKIEDVKSVVSDPLFYIQNITPATLLFQLAKQISSPSKILDLCAAPGGKLLAVHDLFPKAELWANDISLERLKKLGANLEKYALQAHVSNLCAQDFPEDQTFDLILLDVPCSNSGVLNKRPEARWRLMQEALEQLKNIQFCCLKKAATLLSPGGQIWYLTCSILKEENEEMIQKALLELPLKLAGASFKYLPSKEGWDGGFGSALISQ